MRVFISHSHEDSDKFDELSEVLEKEEIPFFRPAEMLGGLSLAEQLREAIDDCTVCVFVATHASVDSPWCGAELGAFWGAGKEVIVYMADSSLSENQLPPQFRGILLERNMFRLAKNLKTHGCQKSSDGNRATNASAIVGNLTIEELGALVEDAVRRANTKSTTIGLLTTACGFFDEEASEHKGARRSRARGVLRSLLGQTLPDEPAILACGWKYSFNMETTTGWWNGYGLEAQSHADGWLDVFTKCLVVNLDTRRTIIAAALSDKVLHAHRGLGALKPSWTEAYVVAMVGRVELGEPVPWD